MMSRLSLDFTVSFATAYIQPSAVLWASSTVFRVPTSLNKNWSFPKKAAVFTRETSVICSGPRTTLIFVVTIVVQKSAAHYFAMPQNFCVVQLPRSSSSLPWGTSHHLLNFFLSRKASSRSPANPCPFLLSFHIAYTSVSLFRTFPAALGPRDFFKNLKICRDLVLCFPPFTTTLSWPIIRTADVFWTLDRFPLLWREHEDDRDRHLVHCSWIEMGRGFRWE